VITLVEPPDYKKKHVFINLEPRDYTFESM
jgi:hypothetical protein